MSGFFNMHNLQRFRPEPGDSIRELRWKAESMLEYLRENDAFFRQFPIGAPDERRANWQCLANLLAAAMEQPDLSDDARLEAHRVWGEETRHAAHVLITVCAYARSDAAQERFVDDPEALETLIEELENARPAALRVLSAQDLYVLRSEGFLRTGE